MLAVERCAALQRRDVTIIDIRLDAVPAEFACPPDADLFISTDYAPIRRDQLCQ